MIHFSEVLLREDALITERLIALLRLSVDHPCCIFRKVGGSEVGYRMAEAVQRSTGIKP